MTELISRSPQRMAAVLLHLTVQLDEQLYARLYSIKPISYEGRLRLFGFAFVTCLNACGEELGGAVTKLKPMAVQRCLEHMLQHHERYFPAPPDQAALKSTFSAITTQYELGWKMAANRLAGSQASQGHAVIRRSLNCILYDEPKDKGQATQVMNQVFELVEALPKIREAL